MVAAVNERIAESLKTLGVKAEDVAKVVDIREAPKAKPSPLSRDDALIVAIASVADVIVTKLAKQNADSMDAVCKSIEANGKAMRECMDELRGAIAKDAEADSAVLDRLAKAIDKLKIPAATVKNDVRHDGIAEAMASIAGAVEKIGKMVAASNENVAAALKKIGEMEAREPAKPAPAKESGGHQFTIERDANGNMASVKAIPIKPHPIRGYS